MTKDKMIYNDDQSIGVDYRSFEKLEAIAESILNGHNNDEEPEHGDFTIKGNTLYLWLLTNKRIN